MLHRALPQTMTKENLAIWIKGSNIETRVHEEKFDLTEVEIASFEHDSSVASREIDRLLNVKDAFNHTLKKGTLCIDVEKQVYEDVTVVIPGTKGIEVLQSNREYADAQIVKGYRTENTQLYGIPYPETKKILFFDIEGGRWEQYDYQMNPIQVQKYGQPLFEEKKIKGKGGIEGLDFQGGDGSRENPAVFTISEKKEKKSDEPFI